MRGEAEILSVPLVDIDGAGLRAVYAEEYGALVGLATLLLGNKGHAEEVVQDTFARLLEQPPRVLSEGAVGGYVRAAVLNRCRSRIKRLILERKHAQPDADTAHDVHPDHALRAALLELPMRQRQCVVLRFYDDRTVDDIAELLSISAGSVKTHLHRGLARLRALLGEEIS